MEVCRRISPLWQTLYSFSGLSRRIRDAACRQSLRCTAYLCLLPRYPLDDPQDRSDLFEFMQGDMFPRHLHPNPFMTTTMPAFAAPDKWSPPPPHHSLDPIQSPTNCVSPLWSRGLVDRRLSNCIFSLPNCYISPIYRSTTTHEVGIPSVAILGSKGENVVWSNTGDSGMILVLGDKDADLFGLEPLLLSRHAR